MRKVIRSKKMRIRNKGWEVVLWILLLLFAMVKNGSGRAVLKLKNIFYLVHEFEEELGEKNG